MRGACLPRFFVDRTLSTYFIQRRCIPIAANNSKDTLVNEAIEFPEVRVIGADGEQLGIMSSDKALQMAYDKGLQLLSG